MMIGLPQTVLINGCSLPLWLKGYHSQTTSSLPGNFSAKGNSTIEFFFLSWSVSYFPKGKYELFASDPTG